MEVSRKPKHYTENTDFIIHVFMHGYPLNSGLATIEASLPVSARNSSMPGTQTRFPCFWSSAFPFKWATIHLISVKLTLYEDGGAFDTLYHWKKSKLVRRLGVWCDTQNRGPVQPVMKCLKPWRHQLNSQHTLPEGSDSQYIVGHNQTV